MELSQVERVLRKPVLSSSTIEYSNIHYQEEEYSNYTPYGESEFGLISHHHHPNKKSWGGTLFTLIFSALWLVPIGVLLYLNIHGHVIGASAWCPFNSCRPDEYNPASSVVQARIAKFDRQNHNLLGGLQFVSKALEVWYVLIATWLVYNLTIILASRRSGLPLAYLTRPSEFAEIPALFDRLLWRSLPPLRGEAFTNRPTPTYRNAKWRVWIFVIFTIFLGIICNVIGPAVAVLAIPSLQWKSMPYVGNETLVSVDCNIPPMANTPQFVDGCTTDQISAQNYSCGSWGIFLDGWIQTSITGGHDGHALTTQNQVSFSYNSTGDYYADIDATKNFTTWAPNRQILWHLYQDYAMLLLIGRGKSKEETPMSELYDSYLPYNNTVQSLVKRNGPVLGAQFHTWVGYNNQSHFDVFIDSSSTLRCYENYNISHDSYSMMLSTTLYTRCVTMGSWSQNFKTSSFSILGEYKPLIDGFGPTVYIDIFNSDRAAFLPGGRPPVGFNPNCLARNAAPPEGVDCDWDLFFTPDPNANLHYHFNTVSTIHMNINTEELEGYPDTTTFAVDYVVLASMTEYSLDPSPETNPLNWVTTPDLPMNGGMVVPLDPSWILAAWGADANSMITQSTASTIALQNTLGFFWAIYSNVTNGDIADPIANIPDFVDAVSIVPVIHALSLVGYTTNATATSGENLSDVTQNPLLQRWAQINVWAYGMSSRTAWLGVVVASLACFTVILHLLFGLIARSKFLTPTQLVVAALEYVYANDFVGIEKDEFAIAKVPFRVEPVQGLASEFRISKID